MYCVVSDENLNLRKDAVQIAYYISKLRKYFVLKQKLKRHQLQSSRVQSYNCLCKSVSQQFVPEHIQIRQILGHFCMYCFHQSRLPIRPCCSCLSARKRLEDDGAKVRPCLPSEGSPTCPKVARRTGGGSVASLDDGVNKTKDGRPTDKV